MDYNKIRLRGLTDINLPLFGAQPTDKYILKSVDGLGPPEINVSIANTAAGGKYQARQAQNRQLVFLIGLNPDWESVVHPSASDLRDELYELLSTGYNPAVGVHLLNAGSIVAKTVGYVSKIEPAIFSKDPAVQLTIDCLDATLKAPSTVIVKNANLALKHPAIRNIGTAEAGFQFKIKFTAARPNWFLRTASNQNIGMEFTRAFAINDVLAVSTIKGSRYIHWNKYRGKVTNKMGMLSPLSEWLELQPGMNHFVVPASGWVWLGPLVYTPQYWGG